MNKVLFSSNSNEWATPQSLFDELNKEFNFTLDPCANEQNHKCALYYTMQDDGLRQNWGGGKMCLLIRRMQGKLKIGFAKVMKNPGNQIQRW